MVSSGSPTASSTNYGCADFLHRLCPFAPRPLRRFIATTGCCPANSQAISCLLGRVHFLFASRLSLCGSFVPCAFALLPALALSFCPIAAVGWCDHLPTAFHLYGVGWFHDDICPQRQYPRQEGERLHLDALTVTSFQIGYSSACSLQASWAWLYWPPAVLATISDRVPALHRASYAHPMRTDACRSIRDFVTPHTGSDGIFTRPFGAEFGFYK